MRSGGRRLKLLLLSVVIVVVVVVVVVVFGVLPGEVVSAAFRDPSSPVGDVPEGLDRPDGRSILQTTCPSLDPCRGGVANQACCNAIKGAILRHQGCNCVCKVLRGYASRPIKLPIACSKRATLCPRCSNCVCRS